MELKDTVNMMQSDDYKERFKAEYWQTKIRYDKLHAMIIKYEVGHLDFRPSATLEVHKQQAQAMGKYLYVLEMRAELEDVEL